MGNHHPVLFEATRGSLVESIHTGAIAIVDRFGNLVASTGDADLVTYMRSSAKPFQALPLIETGAVDQYHLTDEEIAIICASHSGTEKHVEIVSALQHKTGIHEDQLLCGVHPPYHSPTFRKLLNEGIKITENYNNCSGKHTGMLLLARAMNVSPDNYIEPNHPIQQKILTSFAEMTGTEPKDVVIGIDGCSAPNYAVTLREAAWGYAHLCDPIDLPPVRRDACRKIAHAMSTQGMVIAGPERFDTALLEIAGGKFLTKTGAEGYQCMGIMPDAIEAGSPGLGIAFKVMDGDTDNRARPVIALEVLRQLGAISAKELEILKNFDSRPIFNFRHLHIGDYQSAFKLTKWQ